MSMLTIDADACQGVYGAHTPCSADQHHELGNGSPSPLEALDVSCRPMACQTKKLRGDTLVGELPGETES